MHAPVAICRSSPTALSRGFAGNSEGCDTAAIAGADESKQLAVLRQLASGEQGLKNTVPGWAEALGKRLRGLPRPAKQAIAIGGDIVAMPCVLAAALLLKFDSIAHVAAMPWQLFAASVLCTLPVFATFGLYRAVMRYISLQGLFIAGCGLLVAGAALMAANATVIHAPVPPTAFAIYCMLALCYVGASRLSSRLLLHVHRGGREPVAVYGAGAAGAQLVSALRRGTRYRVVAFLDDNRSLQGTTVAGVRVYEPARLSRLVAKNGVSSVLLALPSVSHRQRHAILKALESSAVHVCTIPGIADLVAGHAALSDLRDVEPSDLLEREAVMPNDSLLHACIRGKVVMVSGAGGSIGSELCRQILRLAPARLLLLEMSEPALYQIDRELRAIATAQKVQVDIVPLLGNAHHRDRVREIMLQYHVQTVYHAAAYKHVPIVEQNIVEGIHNNVFSTWYLAEAALESRVETFVLISSDKAVNPTNVMGATKRFAELTLQALQRRSTATRFCMVRFGNVLESSGSVVPLFREQIKQGGPVTVTHRDVIRYFMTIPEASQLVLQASAMGHGGDVFVLDMGKPLRIEDLARRMIRLMGLTVRDESNPDGDIEIVYTGLRPAEKLYEELLIGGNVTGTEHPMIMRAMEPHVAWAELKETLGEMLDALDVFDCVRARELLIRTVTEYRPDSSIQDHVWLQSQQGGLANVTHIHAHRARTVRLAATSTNVAVEHGESDAGLGEQQHLQ
jgi:FlaA1/EpsC-like NDP-sugar epimerase